MRLEKTRLGLLSDLPYQGQKDPKHSGVYYCHVSKCVIGRTNYIEQIENYTILGDNLWCTCPVTKS